MKRVQLFAYLLINVWWFWSTVASVSLQSIADTAEGNNAMATVEMDAPDGGIAIPITVTLRGTDGDASKYILQMGVHEWHAIL